MSMIKNREVAKISNIVMLTLRITKVSFFVQSIKMQLITLQNVNIQTSLWFFSLKY